MRFHSRNCVFNSLWQGHSIFNAVAKVFFIVFVGAVVFGGWVKDAPAIDFKAYLQGAQAEITRHKNIIAEDPLDAISYFELGKAYLALGKHEEEVEAYKEAVQLDPEYTAAHYNLAVAYDLLKQGPKATRHMKIALELYTAKRNHARIRSVQRQLKLLYFKYPAAR
ncbi:MAG: tetratricopeptide repeat protein [Nitrospina sp.]|nr:tetratricopeptide repeat protein [Nitrospina sp.]